MHQRRLECNRLVGPYHTSRVGLLYPRNSVLGRGLYVRGYVPHGVCQIKYPILIFHEITEVSLFGIIISSITRTDKYNKFKTFLLQVIAQFDIFSFLIIFLSNRKYEVPKHPSERYTNQVFLTTYV